MVSVPFEEQLDQLESALQHYEGIVNKYTKQVDHAAALAKRGHFIVGDDAYAASFTMVTPYAGRQSDVARDCFNYWQSSARTAIEQSFGMLTRRWLLLKRVPSRV